MDLVQIQMSWLTKTRVRWETSVSNSGRLFAEKLPIFQNFLTRCFKSVEIQAEIVIAAIPVQYIQNPINKLKILSQYLSPPVVLSGPSGTIRATDSVETRSKLTTQEFSWIRLCTAAVTELLEQNKIKIIAVNLSIWKILKLKNMFWVLNELDHRNSMS